MEDVDEDSVSELPSEIICSEILPRLPAKSLMRFRCVSKPWSSLFRNPSFVTAHRNYQQCPNKQMTRVLVAVWDKSGAHQHLLSVQISHQTSTGNDLSQAVATDLLKLSAPTRSDLYRVQRTNGLICLHFCYTSPQNGEREPDRAIRVFNPSTRDSITIPQPSPPTGRCVNVSHHLGFCPVTNEYKLLQVQRFWDERPRRTIVFNIITLAMGSSSSVTSSWRLLEVDNDDALPLKLLNCHFENGSVCVQGALHWVDRVRLSRSDELERTILVAFDVRDERFRSIILPSDNIADHYIADIIELNGCVGVAYVRTQTMELRILKDYKNLEWVKETISFPVHWREIKKVYLGSVHTGGDVMLLKVSNMANGVRVHLYNTKTKNFESREIVLPESIILDDSTDALRAFISYESCIVPLEQVHP